MNVSRRAGKPRRAKNEVYYCGSVRNIPNTFDDWTVHDINEISYYECFIEVTKK